MALASILEAGNGSSRAVETLQGEADRMEALLLLLRTLPRRPESTPEPMLLSEALTTATRLVAEHEEARELVVRQEERNAVVTVRAVFPGASAELLEQTVAAPIENQINGVEKMLYMSSTSTSAGVVQIQVTFDIGTDIDRAALNVNNRVKQVEARLPQEVRRLGVTVEKGSSSFLQVIAFFSPTTLAKREMMSGEGVSMSLELLWRIWTNSLAARRRVQGGR